MPDISKITLPSGNTYDIKDATARQLISGGISFNIVWSKADYSSSSAPTSGKLATIPKGVVVVYNDGVLPDTHTATGTLPASSDTVAKFYLIYSKTNESDLDHYDEYVTIEGAEDQYWLTTAQPSDWSTNYTSYFTKSGNTYTAVTGDTAPTWAANTYYSKYVWEKIGDTTADYSSFVQAIYANDGVDGHTVYPENGVADITSLIKEISGLEVLYLHDDYAGALHTYTLQLDGVDITPTQLFYITADHPVVIVDSSTGDVYDISNFNTTNRTLEIVTLDSTNSQLVTYSFIATSNSDPLFTHEAEVIPFNALDITVDGTSIVDNNEAAFDSVNVIGANSTFTITQPTVALATDSSSATGRVQVATGITSASASGTGVAWDSKDQVTAVTGLTNSNIKATASGGNVAWNSKDQVTAVTGVSATKTYVKASASGAGVDWNSKDQVTAVTGVSATKTYVKASASGANTAWDSKDSVTVVTGLSNTNVKATASGANTAWNSKDQVAAVTGVSATKKKLTTTSITGVSGSTNITPIESRSSQTTATGAGTSSSTNTDWLKGVSVSNETLVIGAATMDTQTTYSAGVPRSSLAVPTAASSATTVATGGLSETSVTTNVGETIAIDASASGTDNVIGADATFTVTQPTVALSTGATAGTGVVSLTNASSGTDTVIGTDATFTITQPTISLATDESSATGRVQVATDATASSTDTVVGTDATFTVTQPTIALATDTSSATGRVQVATDATASGTDTVIGTDSTFTITQPTVALSTGATAGTGVISVTTGSSGTDTVIGTDSTFTVTDPTVSVTPTTTYLKASASGANTAWNNKDQKSVLKVHEEG